MSNRIYRITKSCSPYCRIHSRPATETGCKAGSRLADNKNFANLFSVYISSIRENNQQIVDFRLHLLREAQSFFGEDAPQDFERAMWCALSKSSDRFFVNLAKKYNWSQSEKDHIVKNWYEMMKVAWTGHEYKKMSKDVLAKWCQDLNIVAA